MIDLVPLHGFLEEARFSLTQLPKERLAAVIGLILTAKRVFCCGLGGSSAIASHFVQDLRKMCGVAAYCPTDSIGEVTARANDEGFEWIFAGSLHASDLSDTDAVILFSTSGNSPALVKAATWANERRSPVFAFLGQSGSDIEHIVGPQNVLVLTGPLTKHMVTQAESLMALCCHAIVAHPALFPGAV